MSPDALVFGDLFLYKEEEYVFLVATLDVWYAAKIITKAKTVLLLRASEKAIARNDKRYSSMPLYCFVELQTREFEGRAAHLYDTQKDVFLEIPKPLAISLDSAEKKEIAAEILRKGSPVPIRLKEEVGKLDLQNL